MLNLNYNPTKGNTDTVGMVNRLVLGVLILAMAGCGKEAASPSIATSINCYKGETVGTLSLVFIYNEVLYTNGDALVTCSISDKSAQYSASYFYRDVQSGSDNGGCILVYDVDTLSMGAWRFASSPTKTATYADSGSSFDGKVIAMDSGGGTCLVNGAAP